MLQVTARSAECSARSGWADQVQAKQQLVTEAGQRGCWDTQRFNRQPACHPLFFSSPYTQPITSDPSPATLKEHSKNIVWKKDKIIVARLWKMRKISFFSFYFDFITHLPRILHFFLMTPWKQGSKKKRLFGANYSQHVLYTTFNELDWRCGHWLWLARPVTEDEPCNLPHVTPVMCTTSPSASNSPLRLQWSRDEAPLKQHNSSRSVSTHRRGRGWRGVELGAHSHNYNN